MLGLGVALVYIGASPWIALSPFISAFLIEYLLKTNIKNKKTKRIESELPSTIAMVSAMLDSGISLTEVIKHVSQSKTEIGRIFKSVIREIDSGVPVPLALEDTKKIENSENFSKFINRLIMMYRFGGSTGPLDSLANKVIEERKIEMKRHSSKTMMYSMVLIVVSSIVPAMFLAYLVVGSAFMRVDFSEIDALLIPVVVFPSIDAIIVAMMQIKRPVVG